MNNTEQQLSAAIAALAELTDDDGEPAHVSISIHQSAEAVGLVSGLPGGRCKTALTAGGTECYQVAKAHVDSVLVIAFGTHTACKVVPV